jgi:hypothetical protein
MASPRAATSPANEIGYIRQVSYDDLIDANRNAEIDAQSRQVLAHETTYIQKWRAAAHQARPAGDVADTLSALAFS